MNQIKIKYCQKCNAAFECNPQNITQCQCYGITIPDDVITFIEMQFTDCLCRDCLKKLATDQKLKKAN